MPDLLKNATHITNIKGIINQSTGDILNEGVAGLDNGEIYHNTTSNSIKIRSDSKWWGIPMTTTSTSSSTSTSTSTSTTTS